MNVSMAAEVLSNSEANILRTYYPPPPPPPPETHGTAMLCELMDQFFDYTNVRNQLEGTKKLKPFLVPYRYVNDERFYWLGSVFLDYFHDWNVSIANRPGNFTQNARDKMFISWQT